MFDNFGNNSSGMGGMGSMAQQQQPQQQPMSATGALQEAPGLPGEDRNGMERLTGETDEQYVLRQTRLRDEAKARMAAKFGGGGLSSASSAPPSAAATSSMAFAQNNVKAPSSGNAYRTNTMANRANGTQSAPASGNWGAAKASKPVQPKKPAVKLDVGSSDDFFASFGT